MVVDAPSPKGRDANSDARRADSPRGADVESERGAENAYSIRTTNGREKQHEFATIAIIAIIALHLFLNPT